MTVLKKISFTLDRGVKAGLVSLNGTGKSTLLKILAGEVKPDAGEMMFRKGLIVGYMPQDTSLVTDESIKEYLRRVSVMGKLEDEMGESPVAKKEYARRDGYRFYARMEKMLAGFGLSEIGVDSRVNTLSSGQKTKVFMAGVLLRGADVLLLDEPTNNLDLPALVWLENFLMNSTLSCIIVSHDRFFLDRVVRKIFEIDWRTRELSIINGRYSDYLERLRLERNRQLADFESQQAEIKRLENSAQEKWKFADKGANFVGTDNDKMIRGFRRDRSAGSNKAARAISKRIKRIDRIQKPIDRDVFRIHIDPGEPHGDLNIQITKVVAGYPESDFRVGPLSFEMPYGSRVAILGLNGTGKSTILGTISGELKPLAGEVKVGGGLVVGNLMQEHNNLPRGKSIKAFLAERGKLSESEIFALTKKFGFDSEEMDKELGNLSPGGRSRLLFALFSALSVNVLLLDEPTNHLDLEALDAVEEVVKNYKGTIILVSHDRYFLKKFNPTDTYLLSEGQLEQQKDLDSYLKEIGIDS